MYIGELMYSSFTSQSVMMSDFRPISVLGRGHFGKVSTQGSHRPGKVLEFDLGPGKLLKFEKSAFCPGIVLEFCKIILKNMN